MIRWSLATRVLASEVAIDECEFFQKETVVKPPPHMTGFTPPSLKRSAPLIDA